MVQRIIAAAAITIALCATAPANAAEKLLNRSFDVNSGGRLAVEVDGGSVAVVGSDTQKVVVRIRATGSEDRLEDLELSADADAQGVTVRGKRDRSDDWFRWMGGDVKVNVTVEVPLSYNLDLKTSGGSLDVKQVNGTVLGRTSGGRINVESVQGEVRMRTSGGSVNARSLQGPVELHTSGGPIVASRIAGGLKVHTSGGAIRIEESGGPIDAHTSGGSINIDLVGANAGIVAKTSGGSINLKLPGATAATLNASTSGGRVTSDLPIVSTEIGKSSLRGTLNGGGPEILARSSGGSINLSKSD